MTWYEMTPKQRDSVVVWGGIVFKSLVISIVQMSLSYDAMYCILSLKHIWIILITYVLDMIMINTWKTICTEVYIHV